MSVMVDWMDSDYKLIYANFMDDWGWHEVYEALTVARQMMSKSSKEITLVLDFVGSNKVRDSSNLVVKAENVIPEQMLRHLIVIAEDNLAMPEIESFVKSVYPNLKDILFTFGHLQAITCYRQCAAS